MKGLRPVPRPKPRVITQRERQAARVQIRRTIRAQVWRRDGGRCRACQRRGAHVHHLQARSRGGPWTTANCVLLCRACHQDVHARILIVRGTNADASADLAFERQRWW